MKKEMYEQVLRDINRLEYLNKELEKLNGFAGGVAEGHRDCTLKISYLKDKDNKVTLDEDGSLDYGNSSYGGFSSLIMPKVYQESNDESYELPINEIVSLNILQYAYDGMMKEKLSLEKKLNINTNKVS